MNEKSGDPTSVSASDINGQADAIVHLLMPKLDQLVIIVPTR